MGRIASATPEVRRMMAPLKQLRANDTPERIYISRTQCKSPGGIIDEAYIEEKLVEEGYVAFHPQTHSLEEQLRTYVSAKKILGLDGSAFHLAGLVSNQEQNVGVILRRTTRDHCYISWQFKGFSGRTPIIFNTVTANLMRPGLMHPNHNTWGDLNRTVLLQKLRGEGFLTPSIGWTNPTPEEIAQMVKNIERAHRSSLIRRPVLPK